MKKEFYDVYIAASMTGCKSDDEYENLRVKIINLKNALLDQDPELKVFYAGDDIESLNQVSELSDTNAANVVMDVENIFDTQYFILIYPEKSCSSTLVESGCALSLKKKSLYCVKNKSDLPYMLKHSPGAYPFVKISTYKNVDEITEKINSGIDIFSDFYSEIKQEIKEDKWNLECPACGQNIKYKILPCSKVKLLCDNCKFTINSQILWYNMSVLNIKEKILEYGVNGDKSLNWAYTLKYTHPSYKYSQRNEREQTKSELNNLFKLMIENKNIKDIGILLVGSNSCIEMEAFPYRFDKNKFWGIDLSEELINMGKNNPKYKECNFKVSSIEDLYNNNDFPKNAFELVIALRVIQSRMDMYKTLNSISDALKLGGKALISIPKQTSMIEVDCTCKTELGIVKIDSRTGNLTDTISSSLSELEIMVDKIKERKEFTNISIFYGDLSSMEYYITFEKKL